MAHMRMDSGIYVRAAPAPAAPVSLLVNSPSISRFEPVRGFLLDERGSRYEDRLPDPTQIPTSSRYCAVSMAPLIVKKMLRNFQHFGARQCQSAEKLNLFSHLHVRHYRMQKNA